MKTIKFSWFFVLALTLCCACSDEETPAPTIDFEEALLDNYWVESAVYFVNMKDDVEVLSPDLRYEYMGGRLYTLWFRPDGTIRQYVEDGCLTPELVISRYYKDGILSYEYDAKAMTLRILSTDADLVKWGWVTDETMQVKSITEDQIVFESPIRECVREEWESYCKINNTVCIRSVWTKLIDEEVASLQDVEPQWGQH